MKVSWDHDIPNWMESHKEMFETTNQIRVNPHDIPIFQWFSHGFPMIYGDLWWFKPLQKQVGLQATKTN